MQFTKSLVPRQIRRRPPTGTADLPPAPTGDVAGRHILLVLERAAQDLGDPAPADVAAGLRSAGARISVLDCYSTIADLVGHRIIGRPDLVIGMLPGRGPALAAVRASERLGVPLLVLVSHDGPSSWGEGSTLRRADRIVITGEHLRDRVHQAGARPDRIEVWHSFTASGPGALEHLAQQTICGHQGHAARDERGAGGARDQ